MKIFINWIKQIFRINRYKLRYTSEIPENLRKMTLYIEHNSKTKERFYAYLKCPCGCEDILTLNLMNDVSPVWELIAEKRQFSIKPSIWRKGACKSHFWIRNNNIKWV